MAYPTPVNGFITDAVTQSNVSVLGMAPAMAMGAIYQASAHSISILFQNTTAAQKHAAICGQAATNQGVMQLYSVNSVAAAAATRKIAAKPALSTAEVLIVLAAAGYLK
ncbi:MAG TPA: RebB family R body protein [Rhizomicrobium sp.]|jgi:hypothetical protein